jgi:4-amino-4-deoxy-L-arabinose transferase-like glycosyltransferase
MHRIVSRWQLWLAGVLGLRLISMVTVPLADTSEPRYAETARMMARSGDWITLWFKPGVPFWGKPPLSFWTEALSFRLFGVTEFAARLPSWLATLATAMLVYALGAALLNVRVARWAVLVYVSCLLTYFAAGAILTDPFLGFGVTLSMVSFVLAPRAVSAAGWWRYGFFIGLAIGLLAKGPLALVLVGGAIVPWLWWQGNARAHLRALPWFSGCCLMAVLVLPWYIAAEIKTPGFLRYFIIGEHFMRFVDSGWHGDLYGTAHKRAYGGIWLDLLLAAFPWSLAAVGLLAARIRLPGGWAAMRSAANGPTVAYLLCWMAFTPLFFTFSGNILWTYVLPSLPAFALLTAIGLDALPLPGRGWSAAAALLLVPVVGLAFTAAVAVDPDLLKSEKPLVLAAYGDAARAKIEQGGAGLPDLIYVDERPFSARFYTEERAQYASIGQLEAVAAHAPDGTLFAIPRNKLHEIPAAVMATLQPRAQDHVFALFTLHKAAVPAN